MNDWMKLLLSMSISGSVLILLLSIMKPLLKDRISNAMMYMLWIIGLLRFIVPIPILDSGVNGLFHHVEVLVVENITGIDYQTTATSAYAPMNYIFWIWIVGACLSLSYQVFSYHKFKNHIVKHNFDVSQKERIHWMGHQKAYEDIVLYKNPLIQSPILIGLINPMLLIPSNYEGLSLEHMISHELTHYRYKDLWIKWLVSIISELHWFNPFTHYGRYVLNDLCELACDERTTKHYDAKEKQAYGKTLLNLASSNRYSLSVMMSDSKKQLKNRLRSIVSASKTSRVISVVSLILILAVGMMLGNYHSNRKSSLNEQSLIDAMLEYKTPYVGDSSKMSHLAGYLPRPQKGFSQRFISIESGTSYGLTVYYEGLDSKKAEPDEDRMHKNAVVMLALVDNMDSITFAFRETPVTSIFEKEKYVLSHTFTREGIEKDYGALENMTKEDLMALLIVEEDE